MQKTEKLYSGIFWTQSFLLSENSQQYHDRSKFNFFDPFTAFESHQKPNLTAQVSQNQSAKARVGIPKLITTELVYTPDEFNLCSFSSPSGGHSKGFRKYS